MADELSQTATREEWAKARKLLLEKEKEYTNAGDESVAERRQLLHVKIDKLYTFLGANDPLNLSDFFEGRK